MGPGTWLWRYPAALAGACHRAWTARCDPDRQLHRRGNFRYHRRVRLHDRQDIPGQAGSDIRWRHLLRLGGVGGGSLMARPDELTFAPLGGVGEIGMNLSIYGLGNRHQRSWLAVDLGVSF